MYEYMGLKTDSYTFSNKVNAISDGWDVHLMTISHGGTVYIILRRKIEADL